ncbi:hypothetical protein HUK80_17590 [Flavobacterium sp. MAH-1]|uniref:Uncharacterized protein n=1 Tax=Flavobacterium agri TaxID=2743471 RepID=A0A7Y8Y549_9FLAO|nr:hypothetical protein [Flavobacterium agri]NUY82720.1 hypothetical protein [Flavobacterium agri]NYA72743.1 hypothetical protein [Flavobacterium agri]
MINSELQSVFIKQDKKFTGFLIIAFKTSKGIFELDNCKLSKIDVISVGYDLYERSNYDSSNDKPVLIERILRNDEMDFIIVLSNHKVIVVGADSNFNNEHFNQIIDVFDLKDLSNEYLENTSEWQIDGHSRLGDFSCEK